MALHNPLLGDEEEHDYRDDLSWSSYRRQILEALKDQANKTREVSNRVENIAQEVRAILAVAGKVEIMCESVEKLATEVRDLTLQVTRIESTGGIKWSILAAVAVAALTAFLSALVPHLLFK